MAPHTSSFISSATGYSGEQELVDSLVREQIKLFGIDIQYMPRKMLNYDKLLHESTKSAFEMAIPMPAYLKSFDGYDNSMEMLTKFGVRSSDELTLTISRSEWTTYYAPLMKEYYEDINDGGELNSLEGQTASRPKEGDLIYFPFDDGVFEIKYVMFDQPFFQLGRGYVFEMRCEKFEYSGEDFKTGIRDIDDIEESRTYYSLEFVLESGGTGTYEIGETVRIYPSTSAEMTTEDDSVITAENEDIILLTQDGYRLYNSSGFLDGVAFVTATVTGWNLPNRKLTLTQFSNSDPTQRDSIDYDVDVDKLAESIIIGDESEAEWISTSVTEHDDEFNDDDVIQEEFDQIKIIDPADMDPFGFV